MLKERLNAAWFSVARFACRIFCRLFFRVRVYGRENIPEQGAFLLISNHQSFLDPLFCGIRMKRHLWFLARDNLFTNWFFGPLFSSVNAIPVKRNQADLTAIKKVISMLKEGKAFCIYPEGTRTHDGKIKAFKPGFGLLCRRGRAAVVPVVVDGAFEAWPRHKKLFSLWRKIVVTYGQCIPAENVSKMNDRELAEKLTQTLRQMQNDCRLKQGKEPYDY